MNNTIADVRDYLCKALAELADSDDDKDAMALKIERAKATSLVADKYIGAVKVEIDAIRLMDDTGRLPSSVDAPVMIPHNPLRAIG
jgi:hypothetical protein